MFGRLRRNHLLTRRTGYEVIHFGRVSIEAQASGVPVLCSDIGGIPETLSPGVTGLLLKPGDIPAWRDAIIALAGGIKLRKSMAENGREWVNSHFSAQVIGNQFEKLLLEEHGLKNQVKWDQ